MNIIFSIVILAFVGIFFLEMRKKWRKQDAYLEYLEALSKKEPEIWRPIITNKNRKE